MKSDGRRRARRALHAGDAADARVRQPPARRARRRRHEHHRRRSGERARHLGRELPRQERHRRRRARVRADARPRPAHRRRHGRPRRAASGTRSEYGKARGLFGRTLGVLGTGTIGREVIERAQRVRDACRRVEPQPDCRRRPRSSSITLMRQPDGGRGGRRHPHRAPRARAGDARPRRRRRVRLDEAGRASSSTRRGPRSSTRRRSSARSRSAASAPGSTSSPRSPRAAPATSMRPSSSCPA